MAANRLQLKLNHAKSEVLWCSSTRRQHQIPSSAVRIGFVFWLSDAFMVQRNGTSPRLYI